MKTIGIMQPYFMPYIGYWQLIGSVDEYIIFDDVNYINRGWINRNRIYYSGDVRYINIPVLKASQNKLINELKMSDEEKQYRRLLDIIRMAYGKAPYYREVIPMLEKLIMYPERNVAKYLFHSIQSVARYFGFDTKFLFSSEIEKDNTLKGEEKIIDLCKRRKADRYVNAIGGRELYHVEKFSACNIDLKFVKTLGDSICYQQFGDEFFPNLSVIDVMMFNSKTVIKNFLNQYQLI